MVDSGTSRRMETATTTLSKTSGVAEAFAALVRSVGIQSTTCIVIKRLAMTDHSEVCYILDCPACHNLSVLYRHLLERLNANKIELCSIKDYGAAEDRETRKSSYSVAVV